MGRTGWDPRCCGETVSAVATALLSIAIAVLVVGGLSALRAPTRQQRLPGWMLLSAALAGATTHPVLWWLLGDDAALVPAVELARMLFTTAAASFGFALLRWVSLAASLLRWRPAAITAVVGLLQVVGVASTPGGPGTAQRDPAQRDLVVQVLTATWPAVVAIVGVAVVRLYGPRTPRVVLVGLCIALLGVGGLAVGLVEGIVAVLADADLHAAQQTGDVSALTGAAGLLAFGLGITLPRLLAPLHPFLRWLATVRLLRRLRPLVVDLAEVAGEWRPSWGRSGLQRTMRRTDEQLYSLVIFIRDASWSLLRLVDDREVGEAVAYARQHLGLDDDQLLTAADRRDVVALAEACWLRLAIARRNSGAAALPPPDFAILERDRGTPSGSIAEEHHFVAALAQAWQRRDVLDGFVAVRARPQRAHGRDPRHPYGVDQPVQRQW